MNRQKEPRVKKPATKAQIVGRVLLIAGVAVMAVGLLYEGANLPWTAYLQRWGIVQEAEELPDPKPIEAEWVEAAQRRNVKPEMPAQEERFLTRGDVQLKLYGYLKLPKIGVSENVVEGAGAELNYAVGHVAGTALPGEKGNCVLAGHRGYIPMHPFRNLDQMEVGDRVIFEDQTNRYVYEVYEILEVSPAQVEVLEPVEGEDFTMSLLTCTPLSTMHRRLVVRSRLVSTDALPPASA